MATTSDVLQGSLREYRTIAGPDLLNRIAGFYEWQGKRRASELWPYARTTEVGPHPYCVVTDDAGRQITGSNFGSQDYLSLSQHPAIHEAAIEAIRDYGVHSAGSPAFLGNTRYSRALERKIADFLHMEEALLFPTGFAAGAGVIKGLVRSMDYVVMDSLAHACLQDGAAAATKNVYLYRHLDVDSARRWLRDIRAKDAENAILVVTEGLFSMDSDTPNIAAMKALCDEYQATLMVDVAHDLGALGPGGGGHIAAQEMLGKVDIVMGSFSKTFASNGGFVAVKGRHVKEYLRYFSTPGTFSNALSPIQAAIVLRAFNIVESAEGDDRRAALMRNVLHLRQGFAELGITCYGDPSAIVAAKMGTEALARLTSRNLARQNIIANLVEFPAVPKGAARFRYQVMAAHEASHLDAAIKGMAEALCQARHELVAQPGLQTAA